MARAPMIGVCLTIWCLLSLPPPGSAADPDPLQDFCVADLKASPSLNGFPCKPASGVNSDDFFSDGLSREGVTNNPFRSDVTTANVRLFPGLNTLGVSMNRVDIAPGGINPPHLHPRASEVGIVIQGKLLVGFITTGNVLYSKVLGVGQIFVIPRGLVHFQLNVGQVKALTFSGFNSHFAGSLVVSVALFNSTPSLPNDVLAESFLVGDDVVNAIKSKFAP